MEHKVKIYLAGPEVFYHNSPVVFEKSVALCMEHGFEPLSPFDAVSTSHIKKSDEETAHKIYRGNISLIDQSNVVIANLNSFRGSEPDSGTVFEVGYAIAKEKIVIGFIDKFCPYHKRVAKTIRVFKDGNGCFKDSKQRWVEDMGLPLNLMLGCSVELVEGGLKQSLKRLSDILIESEKDKK